MVALDAPDPFPDIPPSLLNAADIAEYAIAVPDMISGFDRDRLKPASYEIMVGDRYAVAKPTGAGRLTWEYNSVASPTTIPLEPNSLIYVSIDTQVRLPRYLAARFNLTILHVYRGLFAGSGPMVDPEFRGHLFIPLHNLSSVHYELAPGEPLLYMEFTKLSPHTEWSTGSGLARAGARPVRLATRKSARDLHDYLQRASPNQPINSSIVSAVREFGIRAESVEGRVRSVEQKIRIGIFGALIAGVTLFATLAAIVIAVFSLVRDVNEEVDEVRDSVRTELETVRTTQPAPPTPPAPAAPDSSASN